MKTCRRRHSSQIQHLKYACCCLLLVDCCLLLVACCLLLVACCLLLVACCLLRVACCLLLTHIYARAQDITNMTASEIGGAHTARTRPPTSTNPATMRNRTKRYIERCAEVTQQKVRAPVFVCELNEPNELNKINELNNLSRRWATEMSTQTNT
jgi:hypothetical protein